MFPISILVLFVLIFLKTAKMVVLLSAKSHSILRKKRETWKNRSAKICPHRKNMNNLLFPLKSLS